MKNPMDYMRTGERVLVDKGDLMLLIETAVEYFYDNDAPDAFVAETLAALCKRNRFPASFMQDFTGFILSLDTAEGERSLIEEAERMGVFDRDDAVGRWARETRDKDEH